MGNEIEIEKKVTIFIKELVEVCFNLAEIVNSLSFSFASQNIACFSVSQYLQQINDEDHLEKY